MRHIFIQENTAEILRGKIKKQKWLQNVYKAMLEYGDTICAQNPPCFTEKPTGCHARIFGGEITTLYTSWLLSEEKKYLDKAMEIFRLVLEKDFPYYYSINHHLGVGDAALSVAVCYDLLADFLTPEEDKKAVRLMTDLAQWLHSNNCTWGLPEKGVTSCNHNSVHYSGVGLCGMILENQEWIDHALEREKLFLKYAADDTGYITEGVGYANYGLTTAIIFCEAYRRYSGIDLFDLPGNGNQIIAHILPIPGRLLQINDHGNGGQLMPQAYLMSKYHNGAGLYLINQYEEAADDYFTARNHHNRGGMVFPFLFLTADENLDPVRPGECGLPLTQYFSSGRIMTRSAWDDPMACYMSINCGECYHGGHNHADKGSFTIYALGEEFLIDPGTCAHDGRDHNIMMINGVSQRLGTSRGEILECREDENSLFAVCDTIHSYEYTLDSLLGFSRRNILIVKKPFPCVIIRDDMQVEREFTEEQFYEFMIHSAKGNRLEAKEHAVEITGQNYGNKCRLEFVFPENVKTEISHEVRQQYSYRRWNCTTENFEEAIASCHRYNPFLTTVITFAQADGTFPEVRAEGNERDMSIHIRKDAESCSVYVTRYDMNLK